MYVGYTFQSRTWYPDVSHKPRPSNIVSGTLLHRFVSSLAAVFRYIRNNNLLCIRFLIRRRYMYRLANVCVDWPMFGK